MLYLARAGQQLSLLFANLSAEDGANVLSTPLERMNRVLRVVRQELRLKALLVDLGRFLMHDLIVLHLDMLLTIQG